MRLFLRRCVQAFLCISIFLYPSYSVARELRCGSERWPVKTASDSSAQLITIDQIQDTTVNNLRSLIPPPVLSENERIFPVETTVYRVHAQIIGYKLEEDQDYHVVIADPENLPETMIVEIVDPKCPEAKSSAFANEFKKVRKKFKKIVGRPKQKSVKKPKKPLKVIITGVGFFDEVHGQIGVAPNGIELHPVLNLEKDK